MIAYISLSLVEISTAVSVFTVKALPVALLLSLFANETLLLSAEFQNFQIFRFSFCVKHCFKFAKKYLETSVCLIFSPSLSLNTCLVKMMLFLICMPD